MRICSQMKAEIERVKPLSALQAKLYNKEMVKHEFFSCYQKQNATCITIDLDKNTYEIKEHANAKA